MHHHHTPPQEPASGLRSKLWQMGVARTALVEPAGAMERCVAARGPGHGLTLDGGAWLLPIYGDAASHGHMVLYRALGRDGVGTPR